LNFFAGNLRRQNEKLEARYKESQDIKDSLEVRVEARKKELEEIAQKLNEEVSKKTNELQSKIKELEESGRQVVKRELRMLELKKEIKKL
jgi:C4-dicarboxylate-specific signal transduction histidine kinase